MDSSYTSMTLWRGTNPLYGVVYGIECSLEMPDLQRWRWIEIYVGNSADQSNGRQMFSHPAFSGRFQLLYPIVFETNDQITIGMGAAGEGYLQSIMAVDGRLSKQPIKFFDAYGGEIRLEATR